MTKVQKFESVWDALEEAPGAAANMRLRSELMIALRRQIDSWDATQAAAARKLALTQPRLNDLLQGHIEKFSLDALFNLAARAGLTIRVEVRPAA